MERLLTTEEAAEYLRVNAQTLADWRYRRVGPRFVKLGARRIRYRLSDIDAWLKESTERSC